ncbi:MAG: FAD-dependent oxidoreductase [Bacteroidetes bacterium]|nr:FAD-dependent oxidoreductase [bacterium]NBP65070.1 FAD-dependent oxidoreductase [Bacteroidota bacterium]
MSDCFDVIIIGSGIAGLYAAYTLKRQSPPNTTFLILEKNPKKWMGGRAGNEQFYGADVVVGAGVGRKNKDRALIRLMNEVNVKYSEFEATREYTRPVRHLDITGVMQRLRSEYKSHHARIRESQKTFKQFFIDILGESQYNEFVVTSGYTDFEDADIYETLYHYGMDDNVSGWTALHVPWNNLVERLYDRIGGEHFRFSTEVVKIDPNKKDATNYRFEITTATATATHKKYYANKVIVATTIQGVRHIVPGAASPTSIYQHIRGQPFLIVYAKFDKASTEIMKKHLTAFTVVTGPLQKLIPMDPDKGVYMIAYTDNQHAKSLKARGALKNTPEVREMYSKWISHALGIPKHTNTNNNTNNTNEPPIHITAIRDYYWNDGTHYYTPLDIRKYNTRPEFIRKAQRPMPGMVVVGEMVSRHQGWVEGALESVDAVITREWMS